MIGAATTTDCTTETYCDGKRFILANRQCFSPLMTLLFHNYLVRSMACSSLLTSNSLIRCAFFFSPFFFTLHSFVGPDMNKSQILRFMLFSLAFSNPQTFPLGLYVRITASSQAELQKSESLFMYHYLLIPTASSPVRQ
jgi:hypothetical protein